MVGMYSKAGVVRLSSQIAYAGFVYANLRRDIFLQQLEYEPPTEQVIAIVFS